MLGSVQQCLDTWLYETPGTGVKWFFLTPDDGLGVGVCVEVIAELSPWEGVELFDTGDGGCLALVAEGVTVFVECGIDLTCAEDHTVNLFRLSDGLAVLWVRDDPLEVRFTGELFELGAGKRMTKKSL